jgi:hypothetical protein
MRKCLYGIALLVAIAWLSEPIALGQSTYNATTCNKSDVQAAITLEQASKADGDIITIPTGTCTWTGSSPLSQTFTNSITFQGNGAVYSNAGGASTSGTDNTVILDGMTSSNMLQIGTTAGKSFRWTGIALEQNGSSTTAHTPMISISGGSTAVRIDHNHFYSTISGNIPIAVNSAILGVADHNFFDNASSIVTFSIGIYNGGAWNGDAAGYGDESWVDTDHFGTNEFFFLEDSRINNGGVGDCTDGGRFVYRYFTAINSQIYSHGTTNGRPRGCRAGEVYQGTFTGTSALGVAISNNSGPILAWGNSSTSYRWLVESSYVRQNNATYTYLAPPNGWGYCGNVQSGVTSAWDQNTSSVTGYRCLDAPGAGAGQLITGANFPAPINSVTSTQSWPNQVLDPIYVFANAYATGGFSYTTQGYFGNNTSGYLTDNQDFYQQFDSTYGEPGTFNGTKGVGQGTLAPTNSSAYSGAPNCSPSAGYWDTTTQALWICTATNTWTSSYAPYQYPYPYSTTLATPTASPAGGSFTSSQSVLLTLPPGSTGCYTIDSSTPAATTPGTCSHGTTYSGAISVNTSLTLQAIATETGYTNSAAGSWGFTITPPANPPTNLVAISH